MARIPYPEHPVPAVAGLPDLARLNITRMLSWAGDVGAAYFDYSAALLTGTDLEPRLRELVIVLVANLAGAPYELAQHEPLALANGVTEGQLAAIADGDFGPAHCFTERERTALTLVAAAHSGEPVDAAPVARAYAEFGGRGLLHLLLLAANMAGLATILNTLQVEIDDHHRLTLPDH